MKIKNKMSEERMAEMGKPGMSPIVTWTKDIRPLRIFVGQLKFIGDLTGDYMMAISHNRKTDELTMNGRLHYDWSGNKLVMSQKNKTKKFKLKDMPELEAECKMLWDTIRKMPVISSYKDLEVVEFKVGEKHDDMVRKLDDSGLFNIGVSKKKKGKSK